MWQVNKIKYKPRVTDYVRRLRAQWKFELLEIPAGRRSAAGPVARAVAEEGERVLAALRPQEQAIALDERGSALTTRELAARLAAGEQAGLDLACRRRGRSRPGRRGHSRGGAARPGQATR